MNKYETTYLDNTSKIMKLVAVTPTASESAEAFYTDCTKRTLALRPLIAENMTVLRDFLIPLFDDILSCRLTKKQPHFPVVFAGVRHPHDIVIIVQRHCTVIK